MEFLAKLFRRDKGGNGAPAGVTLRARDLLQDVLAEKMSIAEVNPTSLRGVSDQELLNLHLRTHQLWGNFGPDETVFNAHLFILHELLRRGLRHRVSNLDSLDRESFEKNPKLLEEFRVLLGKDRQEIADLKPKTRKLLESLEDVVLIPSYISITGSSVYREVDREPNDIDIVVRSAIQDPVAEFKLTRFFGQLTDKPLHWVYAPEGPCFTHVPVYDLVLRRRRPLRVEVVDTFETRSRFYKDAIEPLKPFPPYDVSGEFYVDESEGELKEWVEERLAPTGVVTQPKWDGLRILVHKKGDKVAMFTEDELRDRSELFPDLVKTILDLPIESFIIDTEFVEHDKEGRPLPRPLMTWIATAKPTEEYLERAKRVVVNVHDLVYLNGEDLSQKPYTERLEQLKALHLPEPPFHFTETWVVTKIEELDDALKKAYAVDGSEGALLKKADFRYTPGRPNPDVAKMKLVKEIDCLVIGWRKAPKARPADEHWTVEEAMRRLPRLLEESNTYFFRCAIKAGNDLIPIETKAKLAPGDLHFRWNEEKQTWEGEQDPALWTMAPGWDHRGVGEYGYASTYAVRYDGEPEFGMIVTVAPTQFTPFEKYDEQGNFVGYSYSWTFPRVRGFKPKGSPPAELGAVLAAFGYDPQKIGKYSVLTKQEPDLEEEQEIEEVLTHNEQRRLMETQFGDPYMIHQKGTETYPFVVQRHTRGIFSPKQLEAANKEYEDAAKDEETWATYIKKYELETFKSDDPIDGILKRLREDLEEARTARAVQQVLARALRPAPFGTPKERLIQRGNAHLDLRLKSPDGDYLIGWTLDTPSVALQFLNGTVVWPMRDKFTEYRVDAPRGEGVENILTQRKSVQPKEWLTYVTPERPTIELEPREVGATAGTGARYDFVGKGEYVAGVQKSDYHEYFLFFDEPELKKLDGRWGVQLIAGPFEDIGRFAWITNRPFTQAPYITTHDKEEEEAKARRENVNMIWNEDTLKALEKVGFVWPEKIFSGTQQAFRFSGYNKYRGLRRDFLVAQQVPLENVVQNTLKLFALEGYEGVLEVIGEFLEPIPDPLGEGTKLKGTVAYLFDPELWTEEKARELLSSIGANSVVRTDEELIALLERVTKQRVVQFCKVDEEKRLVTGVVLEPFKVDSQGDWETPEDIEKAMLSFMENSRPLGFMHEELDRRLKLIENYIAPVDFTLGTQHVTKGSWIMTVKVYDDEIWQLVKERKITGFSIAGKGKRVETPVGVAT